MLNKLEQAIQNAIHLTYINPRPVHICKHCGAEMLEGKNRGKKAFICFSCHQLEINGVIKYKGWRRVC